jgi:2-dehydro-3-deoxygluconokinase
MYDLTTIGTLTVDFYFQSDNLTSKDGRFELAMGGKYFTDHFCESLGGGATNTAIGVTKHGLRTSLVTLIGKNSFRPFITEKLQESGVSYIHSKIVGDHLNTSCILLSKTGEKTVINYQTPHQHLFSDEDDFNFLLRTRSVYMANLPNVAFSEKLRLLKFLKHHNILVFANLGVIDCRRPKEQVKELLELVDVVIVNGYEFSDMVKTHYSRIAFHKDVVSFYFPEFKEKVFIITEGERGSFGYLKGKHYHQAAIPPAKIVDSTGAGDGYTAGFIAEYLQTGDIQGAMLSGAKYASKILEKVGAN